MIKGILFDKDGTLIDFNRTWLPLYQKTAEYLATEAAQPERAAELLSVGGFVEADQSWVPDSLLASGSNQQIYDLWSDVLGIKFGPHVMQHCQQIFKKKAGEVAAVVDDIDGFMARLQGMKLSLGVATMDDEASAIDTLTGMGCFERFDFVCGADSGFGVKPDPGMVLAFCDRCGLEPSEVIMVGDSPRDLLMGKHAGVAKTIGVLTGAATEQTLLPLADQVYQDISGLFTLLSAQQLS